MSVPIKAWKITSSDYGTFWRAWVEWPEGVDYVPGQFPTQLLALAAASEQRDLGMPWSPAVVADMWRRANEPSGTGSTIQIGSW